MAAIVVLSWIAAVVAVFGNFLVIISYWFVGFWNEITNDDDDWFMMMINIIIMKTLENYIKSKITWSWQQEHIPYIPFLLDPFHTFPHIPLSLQCLVTYVT